MKAKQAVANDLTRAERREMDQMLKFMDYQVRLGLDTPMAHLGRLMQLGERSEAALREAQDEVRAAHAKTQAAEDEVRAKEHELERATDARVRIAVLAQRFRAAVQANDGAEIACLGDEIRRHNP